MTRRAPVSCWLSLLLLAFAVSSVLAANWPGEATNASLAVSDGQLFMRTDKSLWCFGVKP